MAAGGRRQRREETHIGSPLAFPPQKKTKNIDFKGSDKQVENEEVLNHQGYKYTKYNVPVPNPLVNCKTMTSEIGFSLWRQGRLECFHCWCCFHSETFTFRKCQTNTWQDRNNELIMPRGHADCNTEWWTFKLLRPSDFYTDLVFFLRASSISPAGALLLFTMNDSAVHAQYAAFWCCHVKK